MLSTRWGLVAVSSIVLACGGTVVGKGDSDPPVLPPGGALETDPAGDGNASGGRVGNGVDSGAIAGGGAPSFGSGVSGVGGVGGVSGVSGVSGGTTISGVARGGSGGAPLIGKGGSGGAYYESVGGGPYGTGGSATSEPQCGPGATPAPLSAWQPRTAPNQDVYSQLAEATQSLVGHWRGIANTQFVSPYEVEFTFSADGGYSGHCTSLPSDYTNGTPDCCRALYYGTDKDSRLKQWLLVSANANGTVNGDINIIYDYADAGFGESGYQGKVYLLEFDATGDRARFTFLYGELKWGTFDLQRIP